MLIIARKQSKEWKMNQTRQPKTPNPQVFLVRMWHEDTSKAWQIVVKSVDQSLVYRFESAVEFLAFFEAVINQHDSWSEACLIFMEVYRTSLRLCIERP